MARRRKTDFITALGVAGLAFALGAVLEFFVPALPFSGLIALAVVYFAFAKPRKIGLVSYVLAYLVLTFIFSITILGSLFSLAVMI